MHVHFEDNASRDRMLSRSLFEFLNCRESIQGICVLDVEKVTIPLIVGLRDNLEYERVQTKRLKEYLVNAHILSCLFRIM